MPKYIFQIILPNVKFMYEHLYKSWLKKRGGSDHVMLLFASECTWIILLYDNKTPSVLLINPEWRADSSQRPI